ncbi:T9SS type A sorting domain-containing protein [Microvirga sp. STS02]|uniref:T9SS type A sorting domain-containing protein n=1 Tax=Hymenobacter negativus TaxID=2795026 RepID=UPI0018DC8A61|nr:MULTISPECIES: T9SS type A sorting domain-containing protein [Bacteria]MBH8570843.1 T9SS type A sorting domain-containing protein [Hymenobacter negativus]MBR7210580.1 T9SS type A sorting domain-containing protein [Microvirga sp. STS02]
MRHYYVNTLLLIGIAVSTVTSVFAQTPVVPSVSAVAKDLTAVITPAQPVAVVNAQQLNNGSSVTCGAPSYQILKDGPVAGSVYGAAYEYYTLSMTAPAGTTFTSIDFASYGLPIPGLDENFGLPTTGYALGSCDAANSVDVVGSYLLGQNSAAIPAVNATFGIDPCGVAKRLYAKASYINGTPASSLAFTAAGTYPVVLVVQDGCGTSIARATVTVIDARCGNKNNKVNLCHNGQQICIGEVDVPSHLAHGDSYGECRTNFSPAAAKVAASAADMVVQALPNPTTDGQFQVHVQAASTGPVQVNLFDMQGHLVSQLYNGRMELGEQRDFAINRPDMVKGLYLVRVENGTQARSLRIEVQK